MLERGIKSARRGMQSGEEKPRLVVRRVLGVINATYGRAARWQVTQLQNRRSSWIYGLKGLRGEI